MKKVLFVLFKLIAAFILFFIIAFILAVMLGLKVDMSSYKANIEQAAKHTLGREVEIRGPVIFKFSHLTAIDLENVYIKNVPNASKPYLIEAKKVQLEVSLFPLLKGDIYFSEVISENVNLNFENTLDSGVNWIFPKTRTDIERSAKEKKIRFKGVDTLLFKNILLTYYDESSNKTVHTQFETMRGEMSAGKSIRLDVNGQINKIPFHVDLEGLPIEQLINKTKPWAFQLSGEIGGRKISAKGSFVHDDVPEVKMMLGVKDVDIGVILSSLGLVEGLSASARDASFKFSFKGNNLKQILEKSTMHFVVNEANWKVNLFKGKNSIDLEHLTGNITVEQGNNLKIDLTGNIQDEPLKLKIEGAPLVAFVEKPDSIPIVIDAEFTQMKFQLESILALPVTSKDINLALAFSGERLDSANELLELDLPAIGPFEVDTHVHPTDKGYDISKLSVEVGNTTLNGKMNLDLTQKKPVIDMTLYSDRIQVNDFLFKKKNIKKLSKEEEDELRKLLSKEVLDLIHANIKIEAKEILSGKDRVGAVSTIVKLQNSRLTLDPLQFSFPGGIIDIDFSFLPQKHNAVIDLKADIDKFDIGILARRSKPGTNMGGSLYLDAELHSVTPNIKEMIKNATGYFDFGIIPKNFSSGVIDLWAVNLVYIIMRQETEKDQSQVNCFIMRYDIENGLMQDKVVYMDTTNMSISGEAKINFKKETINIVMSPKAKNPQFFSLANPIKVQGSFKDFGVKLKKSSLPGTVISFITSPVVVPIKRIFIDTLPTDGKDACLRAWEYTGEKKLHEEVLDQHTKHLEMLEDK